MQDQAEKLREIMKEQESVEPVLSPDVSGPGSCRDRVPIMVWIS